MRAPATSMLPSSRTLAARRLLPPMTALTPQRGAVLCRPATAAAVQGLLGRWHAPQRRWAAVHDVRFLATTQAPSRSVTEKYREQLERKAREEGHGGIDELKDAYRDKIHEYRRSEGVESVPGLDALLADAEPPTNNTKTDTTTRTTSTTTSSSSSRAAAAADGLSQPPPPPPQPAATTTQSPASGSKNAAVKPLFEILDLPKARELPEKELSAIWRLRHASSANSLCAVIPYQTYSTLEATARRHPIFVLPVPRGEEVGAEIHFLQWVFDAESQTATVLFTQLAEYKARGEFAQPHTSVTHYFDRELAERQGVVLMAGSLVEGRGASVDDARWLVMLMQRFYSDVGVANAGAGAGGQGNVNPKRALLEAFGRGDNDAFTVEKLLEESERLG